MKIRQAVLSLAIEPKTMADQERLGQGLHTLMAEDPALRVQADDQTGQVVIAGVSELHLEIIIDRLKREFGVEARVGRPQVLYKETITRPAAGQGRYVAQTGGRGQYGHAKIRLLPRRPGEGEGYEFVDHTSGGEIPKTFIEPIDQGVREAMTNGIVAGYPVVDVRVELDDGSYHAADSSEAAFKIAGSNATDLRSRTRGRATYSMRFDGYQPRPGDPGDRADGDRHLGVTAPLKPTLTGNNSAIALPEPDDDRLRNGDDPQM